MKSILLIMPYGSVGGMERLALTFYNHYKSKGYKVKALKIIKLNSDIINFGDDELYLSRVDFGGMSTFKRMSLYASAPLLIRNQIRKHGITHSIAFGDMANMFSSLTGTSEHKVGSIHALKSVEFINKTFLNTVFRLGYRSSYRFLDKVVCISEAIREDIIKNCGFAFPDRLHVIYNPHDIAEILKRSTESIDDTSEEKLFGKNTVMFLGRLSIQKAPWHLVKAFSMLRKENPDAKLVFVGDGDSGVEQYTKGLVENLSIPDVYFLGRKTNPYKYLKKAGVLALSSYYEGTPNVIVEAIALGIPVATSNCTDGITEIMAIEKPITEGNLVVTESGIITPNFFKGTLSIPENIDDIPEELALAQALAIILSNDKVSARLNQERERLLQKFDLNNVAEAYLK